MKKLVYVATSIAIIIFITMLYKSYTTVRFNGITINTPFIVTVNVSTNSVIISKVPPDGTLLTILSTGNITYDAFVNGNITNRKNEIQIQKKIDSLKDGTKVYFVLAKPTDGKDSRTLYGHFESKSLSFILTGDGDTFNRPLKNNYRKSLIYDSV